MNGCCCVEASTLVLMADGSQRPIRDLRIGDLVRTETGTAHIRDIIKGRESELIRIGLAQGGNLVATANHPLFTDKGVKRCSEVVVDDRLRTEGGCVAIESIELAPHEPATSNLTLGKAIGCVSHDFEVYNLVLDGSSVFFANGLLVGDDNEQGRLMRSSDEIRSSASGALAPRFDVARDDCPRSGSSSPEKHAPTSEACFSGEDAPVVVTRRRRSRSSSRRRSCCRPRRSRR